MGSSDSTSDAVNRAKSYFLVNAIVGNSLTFALGPELLNLHGEDAPDAPDEAKQNRNGTASRNEEQGSDSSSDSSSDDSFLTDESTSLLPDSVVRNGHRAERRTYKYGEHQFSRLPA